MITVGFRFQQTILDGSGFSENVGFAPTPTVIKKRGKGGVRGRGQLWRLGGSWEVEEPEPETGSSSSKILKLVPTTANNFFQVLAPDALKNGRLWSSKLRLQIPVKIIHESL